MTVRPLPICKMQFASNDSGLTGNWEGQRNASKLLWQRLTKGPVEVA